MSKLKYQNDRAYPDMSYLTTMVLVFPGAQSILNTHLVFEVQDCP